MPSKPQTPFLATARRGRPQRFADVVAQEHITTVLQGALERGKVSHAYLFSGPRGVGKTSTARILAKALNCEQGVVREPCNECRSCRSITAGTHIDIIEIDAASNRGIDNIRDLREAVRIGPAMGRTKVYIIDEVHMMTPDAFNALLKTLEEPPEHAKFILATTEEHKVPETILSRCQRFHFRRIPVVAIINNLKKTYAGESRELDIPEAVFSYVARAARGSVRDAQSLMDQIIAFSEDRVTLEAVETLLGAVEFDTLLAYVERIHQGDLDGVLNLIDEISQRGRDLAQFVRDLIELYRHLMVAQYAKEPQRLIDLAPEQLKATVELSGRLETETILRALEVLFTAEGQLKSTVEDRLVVELASFKLAKLTESVTLRDLIARVEGWEAPGARAGTAPRPAAKAAAPRASSPSSNPSPANSSEAVASPAPVAPPSAPEEPRPVRIEMVDPKGSIPAPLWRQFLDQLHEHSPKIFSYLEGAQPLGLQNDRLTIAIPKVHGFQYQQLKGRKNTEKIQQALGEVFDKKLSVEWVLKEIELVSDADAPPEQGV
ncbi:MAG TPA: DNA polymerase III subunit gamma/tau, partial [Firmicutes bacterium]|nr:DNA polymerase III subunit gamma/tau [Bacillota bacterium]